MSHIVSISAVNQFLPRNKLDLDETILNGEEYPIDHYLISDLEETARSIVLGRLSSVYSVAGWLTNPQQVPTPPLVISATAMLVAGWTYDRQFAEVEAEGTSYGSRRVREAYALLQGIVDETYDLGIDRLHDPLDEPTILETEPVFLMERRW